MKVECMAPHVIRETQPRRVDGTDWSREQGGRSNLVIADSRTSAELLLFPASERLARGSRFRYREMVWVVTGSRRDSGILVAEPIPQ
jgi:hypothetical protein